MRPTQRLHPLAAALTAALLPALALAQQTESAELDRIEVRALPLGGTLLDSTTPVDVLTGEQLDDKRGATLGETLQSELGIHSTAFGPGAARPIIRGLGGSRVRITEDGLNSLDASALSPDHGTSIEPLLIDRVEVLRGPATLLYGSTASGGVVNVIDNRIPETRQDFGAAFELRGGTAGNEIAGVGRIDGGVGPFQFHFDGFYRDTSDFEIPGSALSRDRLAELDPEEREEAPRGILENSAIENEGGTLGGSFVGDWGFAGFAYKRYDSTYGIPAELEEEEEAGDKDEEEEGGIAIDLEQERYEFKAGLNAPLPALQSINLKVATNDYQHVELEGDEVGTTFNIDGLEIRTEARLADIGRWANVIGIQYEDTELEAIGAEAFIPPATTESLGLFWIADYDLDPVKLSAGVRWQDDEVSLDQGRVIEGVTGRDFSLLTVSTGAIWKLSDDWQTSLNWSRSERAPTQEELFADGPHVATQAFEIGDSTLGEEVSNNIDLGLHGDLGPVHFRLDLFYNDIDDFVFLANTDEIEDGLPVQLWSQADAEFYGLEFEASVRQDLGAEGELEWRFFTDTVQADIDAGNGNVPRLSPTRIGAGIDWHRGPMRANLQYYRAMERSDVAEFETETSGYNMLDLNLVYALDLERTRVEFFLKGSNLLDETQRAHTSFLKEFAPLPGLNLSGGIRVAL
ncbi:MAG: TonB-dependent receptor [Wenzhouxiangellaceae bacterium]|nr:TonB-dependent receptor [Wenzhouxiangellaceae bacterium]